MMRFLTISEIVSLQRAILEETGGASGIRDLNGLESALAQPRATLVARICTPHSLPKLPRSVTR
jgi:death on curing protein